MDRSCSEFTMSIAGPLPCYGLVTCQSCIPSLLPFVSWGKILIGKLCLINLEMFYIVETDTLTDLFEWGNSYQQRWHISLSLSQTANCLCCNS